VIGSPPPAPARSTAEEDGRFVDRQVRFQLGVWADATHRPPAPPLEPPPGASNLYTVFDAAAGRVLISRSGAGLTATAERVAAKQRLDAPQRKLRRVLHWMDELRSLGGHAIYALDPQDARLSPQERGAPVPDWPVWQFNRRPWARHAVLWPLPLYHGVEQAAFLGEPTPDEPRWRDKRPQAVWRGALTGTLETDGVAENTMVVLARLARQGGSDAEVARTLAAVPRLRVLLQCADSPCVDAGLVPAQPNDALDSLALLASLRKPALTRAQMREYRYLLCLEGNDYASALYWSLNSDSVVLRQTYAWETFADAHFEPWVHYVPVAADRADIEAKIAWCEAHPAVCERIIAAARATCARLARADLRRAALERVVAHHEALASVSA
jgi:hypothetical protein